MSTLVSFHCANCGTPLELPDTGFGAVVCPVCHFVNQVRSGSPALALTSDTLETQLGALIDQARTGGLELEEIVRVLRDELEFTAELASHGRNLSVQIMDLGPYEAHSFQRPMRDRSAMLRGRAVGR